MPKFAGAASRFALTSFLLGVMSAAALATDLSRYRNFQLGTDLPTIAKQVGASPSQVKTVHRRPAVIQELEWRPQPLGPSHHTESVQEVVFSFYDGKLFQIAVNYDHYETEGLTVEDIIEAISAGYGTAIETGATSKAVQGPYGEQQEILARWQDSQYCFELIRFSYGPSFRLTGTLKALAIPAQAAITEALRLDDKEAPQREAARVVDEKEAERVKLEMFRLVNKPKFRP